MSGHRPGRTARSLSFVKTDLRLDAENAIWKPKFEDSYMGCHLYALALFHLLSSFCTALSFSAWLGNLLRRAAPCLFPYRGDVNCEFLFAVNSEKPVAGLLVISGNGTSAGIERSTCQVQVLANVPDINCDHFMGSQAVTPFHPCRNRGPKKSCRGIRHKSLSETGVRRLHSDIRVRSQLRQLIIERQVTIKPRL